MVAAEDIRALELAARNPLLAYRPGPPHKAFLRDPARFRLLRAPNQSGKTVVAGADIVWRALGAHPFLDVPPPPIRARVICHSFDQSKVIQEKIAGLMPAGVLHPSTAYSPTLGYRHRTIAFRNGSRITIHSTHQEAIALASATVDHVWIDEPPDARTYAECASRLVQTGGTMALTMTPIGRPLAWLRAEVEATDSMLSETHYELSVESCPWMTPAMVAEAVRACLPSERPQRIRGEWDGVTPDRLLDGFDEGCISETVDCDGEVMVLLGADHGERPGAEVWFLVYRWLDRHGRPCAHVWDEYASAGRTTEEQDAEHVRRMLERNDLSLYSVDRCRGDVNTAGKSHARQTVNGAFEQAFATMCGGRRPFAIEKPRKGPGSVMRSARVVNVALLDGRLRVHARCKRLLETMRHWQGGDDDLKHCFAAGTMVATPGGPRPIEDFIARPGPVYCWDGARAVVAHATGTSAGVQAVGLLAGETCTADHEWFRGDGTKIRASEAHSVSLMRYAMRHGKPTHRERDVAVLPWSPLVERDGRLLPEFRLGPGASVVAQGGLPERDRPDPRGQEVAHSPHQRGQGRQQSAELGAGVCQGACRRAHGRREASADEGLGGGDSAVVCRMAQERGGSGVAPGPCDCCCGCAPHGGDDLHGVWRRVPGEAVEAAGGRVRQRMQDAPLQGHGSGGRGVPEGHTTVEVEVYDLSVYHPAHNFILASGYVVSNCFDALAYITYDSIDPTAAPFTRLAVG